MYCPYCSNELNKVDDQYYCQTGDCYFSINISQEFEKITNSNYIKDNLKDYGKFYCVKCGKQMLKDNEIEYCVDCSFEINKSLHYRIIEFNPHKPLVLSFKDLTRWIVSKKLKNITIIEKKQISEQSGYIDLFTNDLVGRITVNSNGFVDKQILSVDTSKQVYYDVSIYYEINQFFESINNFMTYLGE